MPALFILRPKYGAVVGVKLIRAVAEPETKPARVEVAQETPFLAFRLTLE
jgi:hypothetical protein